ncbi:hypothetical protein ACFOYW_02640 [Gryllotalpicola reticulitermitis]|uniref:Multidrug ABC transporter ATPase n=1 Tax=Gryllotalpicola reticulitermitis TaxID=1184153 RepID=A0ABV8Q429_9MICO
MPSESRPSAARADRAGRLQRSLAYFSLTLIGLSIIAIVIIMIVGGAGVKRPVAEMAVVYLFPAIALPLGALGIIAIFVINAIERRRLNQRQIK